MTTRLQDLTYYNTGGTCDLLESPESIQELARARTEIHSQQQDYFLLGGGSNSLVMDTHFKGVVVSFHKLRSIKIEGDLVYAEAGVENSELVRFCHSHGLTGLEWMYRLPGQIGATTRMNARCYGGEISQVVSKVESVDQFGEVRVHQGGAPTFRGYKDTIFMTNNEAIGSVWLQLTPGDPASIRRVMDQCEQDRTSKNQFQHPSCGCVFKNDYEIGIPSGLLLDAAGVYQLKPKPGLEINSKHANFLFNKGCTSDDLLEFTLQMRQLVFDKLGVWLEYEMEILGHKPTILEKEWARQEKHQPKEARLAPLRKRFQGTRAND